jgi:hypothetical protein
VFLYVQIACVYEGEAEHTKPPVGQGLNKQAVIKLEGVFPKEEEPTDEQIAKFVSKLRSSCERNTDQHLAYDIRTGIVRVARTRGKFVIADEYFEGMWTFRAFHFTRKGLATDDSDDEPEDLPQPPSQLLQILESTALTNLAPELGEQYDEPEEHEIDEQQYATDEQEGEEGDQVYESHDWAQESDVDVFTSQSRSGLLTYQNVYTPFTGERDRYVQERIHAPRKAQAWEEMPNTQRIPDARTHRRRRLVGPDHVISESLFTQPPSRRSLARTVRITRAMETTERERYGNVQGGETVKMLHKNLKDIPGRKAPVNLALALSRSFRVGWGPSGCIVHSRRILLSSVEPHTVVHGLNIEHVGPKLAVDMNKLERRYDAAMSAHKRQCKFERNDESPMCEWTFPTAAKDYMRLVTFLHEIRQCFDSTAAQNDDWVLGACMGLVNALAGQEQKWIELARTYETSPTPLPYVGECEGARMVQEEHLQLRASMHARRLEMISDWLEEVVQIVAPPGKLFVLSFLTR